MGSLISPLNYLRLTQHAKWVVDWLIPICFALFATYSINVTFPHFDLYSKDGFINGMGGFIQTLPGFYIAALTAVATFGRPEVMDMAVSPGDIYLRQKSTSNPGRVLVTRRKFLCLMFAYLCTVSLVLTVISPTVQALKIDAVRMIPQPNMFYLKVIFEMLYFISLGQLVMITLWGLYYLSDRIHQSEHVQ